MILSWYTACMKQRKHTYELRSCAEVLSNHREHLHTLKVQLLERECMARQMREAVRVLHVASLGIADPLERAKVTREIEEASTWIDDSLFALAQYRSDARRLERDIEALEALVRMS